MQITPLPQVLHCLAKEYEGIKPIREAMLCGDRFYTNTNIDNFGGRVNFFKKEGARFQISLEGECKQVWQIDADAHWAEWKGVYNQNEVTHGEVSIDEEVSGVYGTLIEGRYWDHSIYWKPAHSPDSLPPEDKKKWPTFMAFLPNG